MRVVAIMLAGLCWSHARPAARLQAQQPGGPPLDSAFLLTSRDPGRSPSPFVGNGRLGVVIPALGIGPSYSYKAGLYEHGPGDVPRIVAVPAWNAVAVFDGQEWIGPRARLDSAIRTYHQTVDMRTGAARTSYDWANGATRTSVRVETFVSRANPHLTAIRLHLSPHHAGRLRVRFGLRGWPAPRRLALAKLAHADPAWKPDDVWYPGHMEVRSRESTQESWGVRLAMTATPVGRTSSLAQAAAVSWAMDLRNATITRTASGDSALVEIAFDALPGRTYAFSQLASHVSSDEAQRPMEQANREIASARSRGFERLAADNAQAWLSRWETDIEIEGNPELQRVVRSMLFYLLSSADSGTKLGIPPMGLSSAGYYGHIFWDSDSWMFPSLLTRTPTSPIHR